MEQGKELTPQQTFEEAIKARLRKDIGELMPDEALAKMVEKATNEMFFTRQKVERRYGENTFEPSWFEKEVTEVLRVRVKATIDSHFEKNSETIAKAVEEEIISKAPALLAEFLIGCFTKRANQVAQEWSNTLEERLKEQKGLR